MNTSLLDLFIANVGLMKSYLSLMETNLIIIRNNLDICEKIRNIFLKDVKY